MKRALLALVMVGIFASSYSQFIEKGSIITNGSFSFYSTKYKESKDKTSGLDIVPMASYFVIDNFAIGVMVDYHHEMVKNDAADSKTTINSFLFGPVARYYLKNGFFAQGDFGFGKNKSKYEFGGSSSAETEYDVTQIRIGIGYAFRIGGIAFVEPIIGYKSRKNKYDSSDDTESGIFAMGGITIKVK